MRQVDLSRWMNNDKNGKFNSDLFMGTMIQSLGELKGYIVQIIFPDLAIPTKKYATNEEAVKAEYEIWESIEGKPIKLGVK